MYILDKIENIIYFYDINNYNNLEEYIYYNNPYEKDDIINNYIIIFKITYFPIINIIIKIN